MNLEFNINEIKNTSLASIIPRLINQREIDRVNEKHECQYRTLIWLSYQFNGITILDLGTRAGTSALCLASNTKNTVISCDIVDMYKQKINMPDFLKKNGIQFLKGDIKNISDKTLLRSKLISLDVSHNGVDEEEFLARLYSIGYDGFVIMDDVSFPRKFENLQKVWNSISLPKLLLPRSISHDTGTGVVVFGNNKASVKSGSPIFDGSGNDSVLLSLYCQLQNAKDKCTEESVKPIIDESIKLLNIIIGEQNG